MRHRRRLLNGPVLQIAALVVSAVLAGPAPSPTLVIAAFVVTARVAIPRVAARPWAATLDALLLAMVLVGDGAANSPWMLVAIAGAWPRTGMAAAAYCACFGLAYTSAFVTDGPRMLGEALKTTGLVVLVAALRWTRDDSGALRRPQLAPDIAAVPRRDSARLTADQGSSSRTSRSGFRIDGSPTRSACARRR